ncbi:MFS transporter [Panacibacter ginsenosidivorans]|uniref:MFS transporter n=1 Tax=Panacibacter ginsenosidivorans TaxID=1813871 RepID=A0A5B8V324_9BACT|nr:MFS transporter [Panacibacter ginsenosidivorans]QEC65820.1 MFS transporter [Panacibacter ginsenosidivorans]
MQTIGKYRWVVVVLLFFATTINYLDRQVIGLLKDDLAKEFSWTEKDYSNIVMAFSAAYALGLLFFGRIVDRIGTKLGYTVSVIIWSFAAMAHALVKSTLGFGIARTALGLGESGNFPSAIKSVAEWFPKKDRAFATGIFNSGSNVAAIIGPPAIAWIFVSYGWQKAFIWTGAIGFLWLMCWLIFYDIPARQKRLGKAEYDYIHSDVTDENNTSKVGWAKILSVKQTWAFVMGKFLTDPVWWFYLFWIPSYFNTTYGLNISTSAIHVSTIYVAAGFGSVLGGYLSGYFIKKGLPVYKARKKAMFIFALCVVPVIFVRYTDDIWIAVALISLATAAHQAWSANIFTTASDMFPKKALSSVVGIGGMAGSVGGILFPLLIGVVLDKFKLAGTISTGYNIIFFICGTSYLLAWLMMHLLAPSMKKVDL